MLYHQTKVIVANMWTSLRKSWPDRLQRACVLGRRASVGGGESGLPAFPWRAWPPCFSTQAPRLTPGMPTGHLDAFYFYDHGVE